MEFVGFPIGSKNDVNEETRMKVTLAMLIIFFCFLIFLVIRKICYNKLVQIATVTRPRTAISAQHRVGTFSNNPKLSTLEEDQEEEWFIGSPSFVVSDLEAGLNSNDVSQPLLGPNSNRNVARTRLSTQLTDCAEDRSLLFSPPARRDLSSHDLSSIKPAADVSLTEELLKRAREKKFKSTPNLQSLI